MGSDNGAKDSTKTSFIVRFGVACSFSASVVGGSYVLCKKMELPESTMQKIVGVTVVCMLAFLSLALVLSEEKLKKFAVRAFFAFIMCNCLFFLVWAGHLYLSIAIIVLQGMAFRELVDVRYAKYKDQSVVEIPLFRTLQWLWFLVAVYFTNGDSLLKFAKGNATQNNSMLAVAEIMRWNNYVAFILYACVFVLSICTLRPSAVKYQIGQLTWTIAVLVLIVGQMKFIATNIFNGIFWFFFPAWCVINNDVWAYNCGSVFGRKFIKAPFMRLSPNKTWEGFIGAFFFTMAIAYFSADFLSDFHWMVCPAQTISLQYHMPLSCEPENVFLRAENVPVPSDNIKQLFQPVFDIPQIILKDIKPIQIHGLVIAAFSSLVAPFGGFLASAIKRSYEVKDFDSIIPGHGGITDRVDCQFLMALYTYVHYQVFVMPAAMTTSYLLGKIVLMPTEQQESLYNLLGEHLGKI
jgi:phosphatidate cytidylyltransferase